MARDARYIYKADNPTLREIADAKAVFKKQLIAEDYDFRNWIFNFDVGDVFKEIYREENNIHEIHIYNDITIFTFYGKVTFQFTQFEVDTSFSNTTFVKGVDFSFAKFKNKAYFNYVEFMEQAFFRKAKFKKFASFSSASFLSEASFLNTLFDKKVSFSSTKFGEKTSLNFINTAFKSKLNFEECNDRDRKMNGLINFIKIAFHDTVSFTNSILNELNFENCHFEKQVHLPEEKDIAKPKREFFRIAKHEELKQNNQIAAHAFYVKEMQKYEEELKSIEERKKGLRGYYGMLFNMWLNKYSTYYGSRWWRGVGFTLAVAAFGYLYYIPAVLDTSWEILFKSTFPDLTLDVFYSIIGGYFRYLINIFPLGFSEEFFNKGDVTDKIEPFAFINIITRIFMGYGIYQTVAAFRRLGKFQ